MTITPHKKQDRKRILRAFSHSTHGFIAAWQNEQAFRQEVITGLILFPALFISSANTIWKVVLFLSFLLLLIVELLNSAVEAIADRVSYERNPLIKNAKDMGSAAVFLGITINVIAWMCYLMG
jgi:diacylglycerol kinase (ATP)